MGRSMIPTSLWIHDKQTQVGVQTADNPVWAWAGLPSFHRGRFCVCSCDRGALHKGQREACLDELNQQPPRKFFDRCPIRRGQVSKLKVPLDCVRSYQ